MQYNVVRAALINYEVFDETDGSERILGTASVTLPDLEFLSSDLKGAGIAGEVSFPILGHTNNISCTLSWRTLHDNLTKLSAPTSHIITLRGAIENYDAASGLMVVAPVKITFRGVPSKATLGKFEPGESTDSENEFSINYLKIEVDGAELIEVDKLNYIYRVNGEDYLSDTREALGV